jgi:hypothetical protein
MLDFSVTCPYCGKRDDPSKDTHLYWEESGCFMTEDSEEKIPVECRYCGKTYIFTCKITGIEPRAEAMEEEE